MNRKALITLQRLLPRLEQLYASADRDHWQGFTHRLEKHFESLFDLLLALYGGHYDFYYHLENILVTAAQRWLERPDELKALDVVREEQPTWFQSERMLGGVCYADLFAGNLAGVRKRIPYFKRLGLTYLHLMPLFDCPHGNNDGGYAVSSYREVRPDLGTIDELRSLTAELRREGISLVLDFVFNHTSDEHIWARRALTGDIEAQEYYLMFPDRTMPDAYQEHLREIFPDTRPGSFTYRPEIDRWVWTTFNSFQWDLNYGNPAVFNLMLDEMLFLANAGVEVLRLDAVAFIWKKLGTTCENLPEAHMIIRAFNVLARIAAPSLLFKSEAIVHPDEVARYIGPEECQLSYNPLLMALLWESLATREVRLLQYSILERFGINHECAWVNYVRCHDDIGWTFDDGDARHLGIDGYGHRQFLNSFYTGRFSGSFARGLPFQENPRTGDARITGTCASLAGLEKATREETEHELDLAINRILLIHSVVLSIGGIPLIYLGDELGTLNDYSYRNDPEKSGDSRWVHRPATDWSKVALSDTPGTIENRVFHGLEHLVEVRQNCQALAGNNTTILDSGNPHVFGYVRQHASSRLLVLANFSERDQVISTNMVRSHGLSYTYQDLASGHPVSLRDDIHLEPYQFCWLASV